MTYPTTLDELTDGVPSDGAAPTTELGDASFPHDDHHRALGTAVEAIETELGTDPSGADATVKARIAATETIANAAATAAALAAEATLARNADNLTSGTVADARIASTIARDSEVTTAVAGEATLARNGDNITSGTVADARIASTIARDSEVAAAYQPLDADLTDIAAVADAQGDILVRGAAGWERLAKSATSTHVLTAGASQPSWTAPSGGGAATDTIYDAKGDTVYATAADTGARVAVGTDRQVIIADSNATPGVRWGFSLIRTRSTGWHYNPHLATPAGTAWPILNRAYYVPFFLPGRNLITAVGINVTAAGGAGNTVRLGIFADDGSLGVGTVLDQGTVAGDAIAFCTWTPSSPVAVNELFWLAAVPQGAGAPGSTWLSLFSASGVAIHPPPETGAAWAGTYVSGIARYAAVAGTFASSPALTLEVQSRNPYLGIRIQ